MYLVSRYRHCQYLTAKKISCGLHTLCATLLILYLVVSCVLPENDSSCSLMLQRAAVFKQIHVDCIIDSLLQEVVDVNRLLTWHDFSSSSVLP